MGGTASVNLVLSAAEEVYCIPEDQRGWGVGRDDDILRRLNLGSAEPSVCEGIDRGVRGCRAGRLCERLRPHLERGPVS